MTSLSATLHPSPYVEQRIKTKVWGFEPGWRKIGSPNSKELPAIIKDDILFRRSLASVNVADDNEDFENGNLIRGSSPHKQQNYSSAKNSSGAQRALTFQLGKENDYGSVRHNNNSNNNHRRTSILSAANSTPSLPTALTPTSTTHPTAANVARIASLDRTARAMLRNDELIERGKNNGVAKKAFQTFRYSSVDGRPLNNESDENMDDLKRGRNIAITLTGAPYRSSPNIVYVDDLFPDTTILIKNNNKNRKDSSQSNNSEKVIYANTITLRQKNKNHNENKNHDSNINSSGGEDSDSSIKSTSSRSSRSSSSVGTNASIVSAPPTFYRRTLSQSNIGGQNDLRNANRNIRSSSLNITQNPPPPSRSSFRSSNRSLSTGKAPAPQPPISSGVQHQRRSSSTNFPAKPSTTRNSIVRGSNSNLNAKPGPFPPVPSTKSNPAPQPPPQAKSANLPVKERKHSTNSTNSDSSSSNGGSPNSSFISGLSAAMSKLGSSSLRRRSVSASLGRNSGNRQPVSSSSVSSALTSFKRRPSLTNLTRSSSSPPEEKENQKNAKNNEEKLFEEIQQPKLQGVLKRPGDLYREPKNLKKVVFLENAEVSRGIE